MVALIDKNPYWHPNYELTASNSQTGWIVAHSSQINRLAACNSKIVGLAFHTHLADCILESFTY